ncbi:MAG: DUF58 domain-containing protein, partial [Opitutales bacterium]
MAETPTANAEVQLSNVAIWEAERATAQFGLPFRRETWRGHAGNWAGSGVGSSIDFQDHRQYLPGDDPRYINWQAYARTGSYSMKLYREEVSPRVDLVLDASDSMRYEPEKARRGLELFFFAALSTLQTNAQLSAYGVGPGGVQEISREAIRSGRLGLAEAAAEAPRAPAFERVPWRPQAMRVLVTDLLFPGEPEALGHLLAASRSHALILAPWVATEADPSWLGHCELVECEGGERYPRNFSETDLQRYRRRYQEHFAAWREACQRLGITLARIPATGDFRNTLLT